ncbi:AmmeMemoRadiSam system radical SAM enzyme [Wukongibacter baidiensis]|uniref:AmmeMemoRadiSam system radical SAM enzyme n=1 Tax=Wukongibacter baidiensis TaxID=1723361 RepID=UPI003D7F8C3D
MVDKFIKEAQFYEKHSNGRVKCFLCPHGCEIYEGKVGKCRVRKNLGGKLVTLNYGKITASGLDPIEKKPLYHFHPGKKILSIGSFGCNLKCSFCQNYSIAHEMPEYIQTTHERIAEISEEQKENIGVAYTYNEPSIWYEFILETSKRVREQGKKNVIVSNGYINREPLLKLTQFIDAMNIDLKAFSNGFYNDICKGVQSPVLETIQAAKEYCHVEITTLLIEGLNTDREEITELCKWIASIDKNIPLHLSRYYPRYKMKIAPTGVETIINLHQIAKKYLNYVYIGNINGIDNNTYCPSCNALIVSRDFEVNIENLKDRACGNCGKVIEIIF